MRSKTLSSSLILLALLGGCAADEPDPLNVESAVIDMAEGAPPFQEKILKDGLVEQAEYEKAIIAARDCISSAGYDVGDLYWDLGQLLYTADADYSDARDPESADKEFLRTATECREQYSDIVSEAWVLQLTALTPEERARDREGIVECLRSAGLEVSDGEEDEDIYNIINRDYDDEMDQKVDACVEQYYRFFTVSTD